MFEVVALISVGAIAQVHTSFQPFCFADAGYVEANIITCT